MTSLRSCICSGQQNSVKNHVETAWILAEIEPNPCKTVRIQRKTMFMRVKMGAEEEIKYIVMCMRVLYDLELIRATRERMFMLQGDRGSRK